MKQILLITLLFCQSIAFGQTIFRVNNTPGITGVNVYTNLQDAHDAASDGDIIYVEPSSEEYSPATLTKKLTIIGNGYFLQENEIEIEDNLESRISSITLPYNEGNPTLNASNSTFYGLTIGTISADRISGVLVERCEVIDLKTGSYSGACSAWTIKKCYVYNLYGSQTSFYLSSNFSIINNIIRAVLAGYSFSTIANNTFGFVSGNSMGAIKNSIMSNNIMIAGSCLESEGGCNHSPDYGPSNSISNNIVVFDDEGGTKVPVYNLPNDNGNISGEDLLSTFLISNPMFIASRDSDLQLAVNSPAKGIGTGGVDAGAFGGSDPYVISGQIPFPIINNFITTGVGNSAVPLNINITITGNN
ncbi:hypothetical protein [Arcticibacterium luteifluviistationis]|uniref:Right handed beta helix domain-containing protein n=1 Tax=Arcticibacterium luteifluviistationis TaxID=1784714 RepID=A0A2Z4G8K0_9BACT|nr:hypothetical protein [Arcticibacterium luteifluviistationis]AWV97542.1 hypothetical protein DJ013_04925 [Arcticibacterium luteifluviistationis]